MIDLLDTTFFVSKLNAKKVQAELARADFDPTSIKRRTHSLPNKPQWLKRYKAGEHSAVWEEICALEDSVRDPAVFDEAVATARAIVSGLST